MKTDYTTLRPTGRAGGTFRGLLLLVVFLTIACTTVMASHFRGGSISWTRVSGNTVTFTVTHSWRTGTGSPQFIDFGDGTGAGDNAVMVSSAPTYDTWRGTVTHTYAGAGPYTAFFYSCCRISNLVNAADNDFRVESVVCLANGNNNSPVTSVPAVIQMSTAGQSIQLAAADADGHGLRYTWSTAAQSGVVAGLPPAGFSLTLGGLLTYNGTAGYTAGQVFALQVTVAENASSCGATTVADFIVEMAAPSLSNQAPTCALSGPASATIPVSTPFSMTITGSDPNGGTLAVTNSGLPAGATLTPSSGAAPLAVVFNWTPTFAQGGQSYPVSVTFTDPQGANTFCSFTVTVLNGCIPPTITCPSTVNATTPAGQCGAVVNFSATASGTTPTITYSPASGSTFPVGTTAVTATATNSCGSQSCTFNVVVTDNQAPTVTCPPSVTEASCLTTLAQYSVLGSSDNCGPVTVTQSPAAGSPLAYGNTTVTLTGSDPAGNQGTCSFVVTRVNVTPTANPDAASVCQGSSININVLGNDTHPSGAPLFVSGNTTPSVGSLVLNANNTFTYTAPAGYSGPVTFTYTIKTNDGTQAFNGNGHYYQFVSAPGICWTAARSAANAMMYQGLRGYLVTITSAAENAFMFAKVGTTAWIGGSDQAGEGVWRWMDGPEAGQQFSGQIKTGTCSAITPGQLPGSYHNWGGAEPNDCGGSGSGSHAEDYAHFRTDAAWNDLPNCAGVSGYAVEFGGLEPCIPELTSTTTVTIQVNARPVPQVLSNSPVCTGGTLQLINNSAGNTYSWSGPAGFTSTLQSPSLSPVTAAMAGTYTVTETNSFGCSASASTSVVVRSAPVLNCPANVTVSAAAGQCGAVVSYPAATATGSPTPVVTYSHPSGSFFPVGNTAVTVSATNACATVSCQFIVTVLDNQLPTISCPASFNVAGTSGAFPCTGPATYQTPVGIDNCPGATTSLSAGLASGSNFPEGVNTVTYTVTDASNNTASCSFTITVGTCNRPPVAVCQNLTVNADGNCLGSATSAMVDNGSSDPDGDALTYVLSPAGPFALGVTNVTLTVTDPLGLFDACTATVTVVDVTAPVISCPADQVLTCLSSIPAANIADASASDNCAVAITYGGETNNGGAACNGAPRQLIRTYVATDPSGNSSSCVQTITIEPTAIVISANAVDATCFGFNDGSIDLSASSSCGPFGFAWTGPNGFSATTEDIASLYAGVYSVVVTDQNGCSNSASYTINEFALVTATISCCADTFITEGDTVCLNVDLGGAGPWVITYSDGTNNITETATASPYCITVNPAATTTYSLVSVNSGSTNCAGEICGRATIAVNQCDNDSSGGGQVTICHIPPGNPGNAHTINIGQSAVPAHLAHGDYIGACSTGNKVNGDKVTICHVPPGNPSNAHTIEVSVNAVPAHMAHGDYMGACSTSTGGGNGGGDDEEECESHCADLCINTGILSVVDSANCRTVTLEVVCDSACFAGSKVLVCHIPPGNPGNAHNIWIGASAVPAHLGHGDVLGACPGTTPGTGGGGSTSNNGSTMVTICHIPPGNPANAHSITISSSALPAHMSHGDLMGPCPGDSVNTVPPRPDFFDVSIPCGNIASVSNSLGLAWEVITADTISGFTGIRFWDIPKCEADTDPFTVTYTVCNSGDACSADFCAPMVAYGIGDCVQYEDAKEGSQAGSGNRAANPGSDELPFTVQAFPNPTNGAFTVIITCETCVDYSNMDLKLVDALGRTLQLDQLNLQDGAYIEVFDLSGHADGMYMLVVEDGKHRLVTRIAKRN